MLLQRRCQNPAFFNTSLIMQSCCSDVVKIIIMHASLSKYEIVVVLVRCATTTNKPGRLIQSQTSTFAFRTRKTHHAWAASFRFRAYGVEYIAQTGDARLVRVRGVGAAPTIDDASNTVLQAERPAVYKAIRVSKRSTPSHEGRAGK